MEQTLNAFLTQGIFAFILVFVRIGTAISIMPGLGDTFTPRQIRLYIALGLSVVLAPVIEPSLPATIPPTFTLISLIFMEFIIGAFIGTITRMFLSALDTGGMFISMASGLGSAQLFNPAFQTQGSLIGSLMTMTGVLMIFCTNMYQLLFGAIFGSYKTFPVGTFPDASSMTQMLIHTLSASFMIGFQLSAPFVVISLLLYIGMGVLARLMPQIQVFMIALPLQIMLALTGLLLVFSAMMLFWLGKFEDGMVYFLNSAG